jgi:hypothetical protein
MALSDDQRAMLRLLAQREEGYGDIAALKGMSVEEVRAEVKEALAQLAADQEAGLESPAAPEPATKASEPEAPHKPKKPAEAKAPAETPEQKVEAPEPPPPPPAKKPARPARPSLRPSRPTIPPERRRLLALTGGAVAIVAVILIAIAVFSDGSDSSSSEPSATGTEAAAAESKVIQAALEPVDGSDASGRGVFGKIGKEEVVLQVTAENLQPTAKGESYTVWLYRSPKLSLRVGSVAVDESGKLGARFAIPAELLAYVASGAFDQIYVSRTEDAAYQREVAQAKKNKSLPRYLGETVLTGEITGPIAKAAAGQGR